MKLYILDKCKYCYKVAVMLPAISEQVEICRAEELSNEFFKHQKIKKTFPILMTNDHEYIQDSDYIIQFLEHNSEKPLKYGTNLYKTKQIFDMQNILFPFMRDAISYYQKIYCTYSFTSIYGQDSISLGPGVNIMDAQDYANQIEVLLVGEVYVARTIIRKEDIYLYPDIRLIHASQAITPFKLGEKTLQYYKEINELCNFTPYVIKGIS